MFFGRGSFRQKKSQGARPGFLTNFHFLWCPVRDSNPHARALGSKPNVSTNSTNRAIEAKHYSAMSELLCQYIFQENLGGFFNLGKLFIHAVHFILHGRSFLTELINLLLKFITLTARFDKILGKLFQIRFQ